MRFFNDRKRLNQGGFDHIFVAVVFIVVIGIIGAGYIVVNGHSAKGTSHAAAGYGNQLCTTYHNTLTCLNAWNGGPWVDVYSHLGTGNNDFSIGAANGYWHIADTGNGNISWIGKCIGSAYNDPNGDEASLDPCPYSGYSGGWGTNFIRYNCSGGYEFKDVHSGKYLFPNGWANGANFDLYGSSAFCFRLYSPA